MWPPRDPRTDLGQPPSSVPLPTVPTWELFQGRSLEMVVSVETIWSIPLTELLEGPHTNLKDLVGECGDLLILGRPGQASCVNSLVVKPASCTPGVFASFLVSPCTSCVRGEAGFPLYLGRSQGYELIIVMSARRWKKWVSRKRHEGVGIPRWVCPEVSRSKLKTLPLAKGRTI